MKLYSETKEYKLYNGNMMDLLDVIEPNSIDSIICDPPYELNFMNKGWDNSGIAFNKEAWKKCFEALKPGGHLLAFGGSRTFHRIACAIEDAGFEIRDCIMWLYGSGFPKSLNIGLAIDKKKGVDNRTGNLREDGKATNSGSGCYACNTANDNSMKKVFEERVAQNEWNGWGTCLKPAYEPIIVARKPVEGSIVENVLKYGVGGLNIDECRVEYKSQKDYEGTKVGFKEGSIDKDYTNVGRGFRTSPLTTNDGYSITGANGRFPANVIHDGSEEVISGMPDTTSNDNIRHNHNIKNNENKVVFGKYGDYDGLGYADDGSASRYFYCAKASKKDRDEGLDEFESITETMFENADGNLRLGGASLKGEPKGLQPKKNIHPTVKPVELMQYLVRLVSPKGATILDCFMGSGSTGKAVMFENRERNANYKFIGIELTDDYLPICESRIDFALHKFEYELKESAERYDTETSKQMNMFDLI